MITELPRRWSAEVHQLHPELVRRLLLLANDAPVRGQWQIYSGHRTKFEQMALYLRSKLPGQPIAADPRKVIGTYRGVTFKGSYHMLQSDGYGYAVDFDITGTISWSLLHNRARLFGLDFTVPTEEWHCQPFSVHGGVGYGGRRYPAGWFPIHVQPPAPPVVTPPLEEATMPDLILKYNGGDECFGIYGSGMVRQIADGAELAHWQGRNVPFLETLSEAGYAVLLRQASG